MSKEKQEFNPTIDPSNTTAQDMFAKILAERLQAGALEKAVTEQVDRLIDDTAKNVFRSYSDLGKALEEQLTKAIMPKLSEVGDLPTYHEFVTNRLKLAAENFYNEKLQAVMDKELEEIMKEVPDKLNLSWIVSKILDSAKGDEEEPQGEITLTIDQRYNRFANVYIDQKPDKSNYECEYDIHLSKNDDDSYEIIGLTIGNRKAGERMAFGKLYGLDKVLFNAYVTKAKIYFDEGAEPYNYETSWDLY